MLGYLLNIGDFIRKIPDKHSSCQGLKLILEFGGDSVRARKT